MTKIKMSQYQLSIIEDYKQLCYVKEVEFADHNMLSKMITNHYVRTIPIIESTTHLEETKREIKESVNQLVGLEAIVRAYLMSHELKIPLKADTSG